MDKSELDRPIWMVPGWDGRRQLICVSDSTVSAILLRPKDKSIVLALSGDRRSYAVVLKEVVSSFIQGFVPCNVVCNAFYDSAEEFEKINPMVMDALLKSAEEPVANAYVFEVEPALGADMYFMCRDIEVVSNVQIDGLMRNTQ